MDNNDKEKWPSSPCQTQYYMILREKKNNLRDISHKTIHHIITIHNIYAWFECDEKEKPNKIWEEKQIKWKGVQSDIHCTHHIQVLQIRTPYHFLLHIPLTLARRDNYTKRFQISNGTNLSAISILKSRLKKTTIRKHYTALRNGRQGGLETDCHILKLISV